METNGYRLLLPEGTLDYFNISAVKESSSEIVIYLEEKTAIKINELLFAGILIASLGAVMDVGMSIASTLQEIYSRRPDLGIFS